MTATTVTTVTTARVAQGHAGTGAAGLRLTGRGRTVLAVLVCALALAVLWVGRAGAAGAGEPLEVRVHTVSPGETLWDHARAVAGPGEDVREAVAEIADLNGLSSTELQVGQRLVLPVAGA